ncbi:MAG: hypothetical protein IJ575_10990 [Selenomonadaceae bacterium]|nr:hypothetical protein [Selenomonadaceae bacterium]
MKKFLSGICLGIASMIMLPSVSSANPTCVLMRFTDDTRFDAIDSAESLSDLLMEKLFETGKFNFQETRPIDENMETILYDEKMRDLQQLQAAESTGDYSPLFEGEGFNEKKAQSIATAQVGQFVTPEVTSKIGQDHNAEYLIQGTIINLGTGDWTNDDFEKISGVINVAANLMTSTAAPALASALGPFGSILQMSEIVETGIGVQADIRIIKASTGEVVWSDRFVGMGSQKQVNLGGVVKIGSAKLSNKLYSEGMNKCVQKIVDALVKDMESGNLFK